ncbi:hypothetical protein BH11MYX3_BH11MYX3_35040 [soil metagenome]
MSTFRALPELIAQHDALRVLMADCERLADEVDSSSADPTPLMQQIKRLREAFDAHNVYEERLLRPVLLESDTHGTVRVERMVEDHVNEHIQLRMRLRSPVTSELRDVIETLRAHLDAEERYLLTSKALRG